MTSEYWFEEGCYILEHLNCADDPAVSVAQARVPTGGQEGLHYLHTYWDDVAKN